LQDRYDVAHRNVPFVFRSFRGSQIAFIALSSQFVDASLRLGIGLQLYQFLGSFGVQASTYRFQEAFEEGGGSIAAFHDFDYTSGSIPLEESAPLEPGSDSACGPQSALLEIFRVVGDDWHQGKEEGALFPVLTAGCERAAVDSVRHMLFEHEQDRSLMVGIEDVSSDQTPRSFPTSLPASQK